MIRPMSPVCARGLWQVIVPPAARPGILRPACDQARAGQARMIAGPAGTSWPGPDIAPTIAVRRIALMRSGGMRERGLTSPADAADA